MGTQPAPRSQLGLTTRPLAPRPPFSPRGHGSPCSISVHWNIHWCSHDSQAPHGRPGQSMTQLWFSTQRAFIRRAVHCLHHSTTLQFHGAILEALNLNSSQRTNEFHSAWTTMTHESKPTSVPSACVVSQWQWLTDGWFLARDSGKWFTSLSVHFSI